MHSMQSRPSILDPCQECIAPTPGATPPFHPQSSARKPEPIELINFILGKSRGRAMHSGQNLSFYPRPLPGMHRPNARGNPALLSPIPGQKARAHRGKAFSFHPEIGDGRCIPGNPVLPSSPLPGMHRPNDPGKIFPSIPAPCQECIAPTPEAISSSYPPPSQKSNASIKITGGYH